MASAHGDLFSVWPRIGIREQLPDLDAVNLVVNFGFSSPTELRPRVASLVDRRSYGSVPARGMPARDTSELADKMNITLPQFDPFGVRTPDPRIVSLALYQLI